MSGSSKKTWSEAPPLQIGMIRTSAIGDAVLVTASLQLLLSSYPDANLHFLSKGGPYSLLKDSFSGIDRVHAYDVENEESLAEVPKLDIFLDYQANLRSRLIAKRFRKSGALCFVLKKDSAMRGILVLKSFLRPRRSKAVKASPVHPVGVKKYQQMIDFTRKSLERAGLTVAKQETTTFLPNRIEPDRSVLDQLTEPFIAIAPGASYSAKRAPIEVLRRILMQVPAEFAFVYLGDGSDRPIAQKLLGMLPQRNKQLNLCGMLSLSQSSFVLEKSSGLIGNDSALTHMAEAVKTPAAVLFGPTSEAFGFAPFLNESGAFSVSLGCRPCSKHGKTACRFQDQLCFTAIDPDLVIEKISHWKPK